MKGILLLSISLLAGSALAQESKRNEFSISRASQASMPAASATLPRRAVLINGFRSAESGRCGSVNRQVGEMREFLRRQGYAIYEFAPPIRNYPAIRDALNGANIVVYWGHGVIMGGRGCFDPTSSNVGGLSIDGRHITPDGLRREVRLADDALVFLPCSCYAAGNASMDDGKVTRDVLEARMRTYARPFLQIGARAVASCLDPRAFLAKIFQGKGYDQAYNAAAYGGKTIRQTLDGCDFRYRERPSGLGIATSGTLFWRQNG